METLINAPGLVSTWCLSILFFGFNPTCYSPKGYFLFYFFSYLYPPHPQTYKNIFLLNISSNVFLQFNFKILQYSRSNPGTTNSALQSVAQKPTETSSPGHTSTEGTTNSYPTSQPHPAPGFRLGLRTGTQAHDTLPGRLNSTRPSGELTCAQPPKCP